MHLQPSLEWLIGNMPYAQGVIELRRFFTEGMMNEDGEEISTRIIKLKIKNSSKKKIHTARLRTIKW